MPRRIKLHKCWKTHILAKSHTFCFIPIPMDLKGWGLLLFFQHCTGSKLPCFARCRCLGNCTACQQGRFPRSSCCAAETSGVLANFSLRKGSWRLWVNMQSPNVYTHIHTLYIYTYVYIYILHTYCKKKQSWISTWFLGTNIHMIPWMTIYHWNQVTLQMLTISVGNFLLFTSTRLPMGLPPHRFRDRVVHEINHAAIGDPRDAVCTTWAAYSMGPCGVKSLNPTGSSHSWCKVLSRKDIPLVYQISYRIE